MTDALQTSSAKTLDGLVDEIGRKLQDGERVEVEAYVRQHPELAEKLRRLVPSMQVLAELGHSVVAATEPFVAGEHTAPYGGGGVLGDYRIIREIGRGGMGVVYEAAQISLQRRVALKMLPFAAVLDERQIRRFQNEARAAAQLKIRTLSVYSVSVANAACISTRWNTSKVRRLPS